LTLVTIIAVAGIAYTIREIGRVARNGRRRLVVTRATPIDTLAINRGVI
jgi:hypothetical protein